MKRAIVLAILAFLSVSGSVKAYTPNIQAALFNAALTETPIIQQQRLVRYTDLLYKTLNGQETIALVNHEYLKIASYMFLVEFWQTYSLDRVLRERGTVISDESLKQIGIQPVAFRTPMMNVGPLNLVFNTQQVGNPQCTQSNNQPFDVTYDTLYNMVVKLQNHLTSPDEIAAQTALLYIKAYIYLRIHAPNSTYTYANNDCLSDVNGLLTCADDLIDHEAISKPHLDRIRQYMNVDLERLKFEYGTRDALAQCTLTKWHYIQSSGASEPLNDGAIIAASEALMADTSYSLKTKAQANTGFGSILKDTKEIMLFIYYPELFPIKEGFKARDLVKPLLINQMKLASYRLSSVLKDEKLLNYAAPQSK